MFGILRTAPGFTLAFLSLLSPLPASGNPHVSQRLTDACDVAGEVPPVTPDQRGAIERYLELHPYYAPNKNARYATAFANGWGVKADLRRATAYACHARQDGEVLKLQINALSQMAAGQKTPPFRYCTYAASLKMRGICGLYAEDRHQKAEFLVQQKAAQSAGFTKAQISALIRLQHKSRLYIRQQASKEYSRTGRDYAIRLTGMIKAGNITFDRNVRGFIGGTYPDRMVAGVDADALLQKKLKTLAGQKDTSFPEGRTKGKLHDVQFFWRDYRDAWLALYTARYPNVDPAPFRAQLTLERLKLVRSLYHPAGKTP